MKDTTDVPRTGTDTTRDARAREERAEADRHRVRESEQRREAAADRSEAAQDRAEGRRVAAVRNEMEAAGHDLAARSQDWAADHDEREAREERGHRDLDVPEREVPHRDDPDRDQRRATAPPGSNPGTLRQDRPATPSSHDVARATASDGRGPADSPRRSEPLLGEEHCRRFRSRWESVQASFIDEPRQAVAEADALVREATDELHAVFERDRRQLEGIWDRGDQVSTEDLRVTLQRYRSFFERLLSI